MSKKWIISDLHYGHKNLCERIRGLDVDVSNEMIISNWNKVVHKRDVVYIIGDLTMDKPDLIVELLNKLNGTKKVILGNHDTQRCAKKLHELGISVCASLSYKEYIITHIPIHEQEVVYFKGNIHGHIHDLSKSNLPNNYYNVNCELHNYTPILLDDVINELNSRLDERC